jgi:hypothetical protein
MTRQFFENAYRRFWDFAGSRTNHYQLLSYELCDAIEKVDWHISFVDHMVSGELRETINLLNAWKRQLSFLDIWSDVLNEYSENEAWALRFHFVEPLVFFCMHQPSSTRDRLGQVASNAVHQANLSSVGGYKDKLEQDKLEPGRFLGRRKQEAQLRRLAERWKNGIPFIGALANLDSKNHQRNTFDYRNQASHFIAPRLEQGEVQLVTRTIVPRTQMIPQDNGTFPLEEIDEEKAVSYGLGGIRPLTLNEIIGANSRECELATTALTYYSALLREILDALRDRKKA